MSHILDRPIWNALTSRHAHLAEGGPLSKRYADGVSLFAAAGSEDEDSVRELGKLCAAGETLLVVQAEPVPLPADLALVQSARLVQMLAMKPLPAFEDERISPLGWADAEEMLALATLTKPGPFTLKSQSLGNFWGVRIDGRIAAMAGHRLKQNGFTELSGVCVHPDFRGRGLARLLSLYVTGHIFAAGEQPYLHAYASNDPAIRLYETLGFTLRRHMNAAIMTRPA